MNDSEDSDSDSADPAASDAPESTSVSSVLDGADRERVAEAYRKLMSGQANSLTRLEKEAVKRHERSKQERLRWQYYKSIPQKHWREMSGRQTKVLQEQAERYDLPFGGAVVDLPAVVKGLHDFLAANAFKLAREEDPLMLGSGSPALEKYRTERAAIARMDRQERQRRLLPREPVRAALGRIAAVLRGAGEALGRQYGPGAADILHEALDDAEREIERSFGKGKQEGASQDGPSGEEAVPQDSTEAGPQVSEKASSDEHDTPSSAGSAEPSGSPAPGPFGYGPSAAPAPAPPAPSA